MGWLSDLFNPAPAPVTPAPSERGVRPPEVNLVDANRKLVHEINSNADNLPPVGTVLARRITDVTAEVIEMGRRQGLNPHAQFTLEAMITSYLPTTLRTYADAARAGHNGAGELHAQLSTLHEAARDLLRAAQENDIRSLEAQGLFLHGKFTGSDLDI